MMMLRQVFLAALAALISVAAPAADHFEAPRVQNDQFTDIADVFLFRSDDDTRLYAILTWGGGAQPNPPFNPNGMGTYNANVLFTFSFDLNPDEDGDAVVAEHNIYIRFGPDPDGNFGMKVENLPGTSAPVVGPVETVITSPEGFRVYSGLRDDPFFFDSIGFGDTLASFGDNPEDGEGQFFFDNTRDTFGFRNVTVLALEMDAAITTQGSERIRFWGTTSRIDQ